MINDYTIKSMLFQQTNVSFYTTKDKINKHLHSDSAALLVLLGLHSQGNASGLAHWEQQGPHGSPTAAH